MATDRRDNRRVIRNGVLFALTFPTLITWIYFVALRGQPAVLQQSAYLVGKVIQFGFPLAWLALWRRHRLRWRPRRARGLAAGTAFGLVVVVLSRWSSGDIWGAWLADKILTLEQTRFSITVLDHETRIPVQAGAQYLLHHGVIDHTVPVRSGGIYDSQVPMLGPEQVRAALITILEEASQVSPKELMIRRKNKQERISQLASGTIGLGRKIRMFSSNDSLAPN